jgi:DNA-binding NarL/FixJ family response regulator
LDADKAECGHARSNLTSKGMLPPKKKKKKKTKTRIMLADDHQLVRAGFRALLKQILAVEVVAEAADGREALHLFKKHRPDVVLIDIAMPKLNGLEAIARMTKDYPNAIVIVLSMYANQEYVMQAIQAGARGYLIKDDAVSELNAAIRSVTEGELYLSPRISKDLSHGELARVAVRYDPLAKLTSRQREILQLIAEGNNTKEIAFLLKLSVKTVEAHRTELMHRLEINDIPSLVRQAMRSGLVPGEGPAE